MPLAIPWIAFTRESGFRRDLSEAIRYSANWTAYLASNAMAHVWMLPLIDRFILSTGTRCCSRGSSPQSAGRPA